YARKLAEPYHRRSTASHLSRRLGRTVAAVPETSPPHEPLPLPLASAQVVEGACGGAGRDWTVTHPRLPARRFRTASVRIVALLAVLWLALGPSAVSLAHAAPMEAWRANQSLEARPVPLQPGTRAVVRS